MATRQSKTSTEHMNDLVPGAMPEAMVKGALENETDLDPAFISKMMWGSAIKALINARGGNFTYNQIHSGERDAVVAERKAAEAEPDPLDEFDDLAEFDDDEDPHDDDGNRVTPAEAVTDDDLDSLLDEITDEPVPPTSEEAGQALFIGMPSSRDYIFDGHAGAGPSGAERWMACTASLGASRAFLETLTTNQREEFAKAGTAARQGTTAHAIGESEARLMLGQITSDEHNNTILDLSLSPEDGEEYDEEMAEYITEYSDLVKQYHQSGHEILIEERVEAAVELTTVTNGERDIHYIKGSADFIALPTKKEPVLTVGDLKYGKGKEVDADENPQAKIYALGVIGMLADQGVDIFDPKVIDYIDIIIIQPRLGGIKSWRTSVDDLLEWRDDVLSPALTEALAGLRSGAKFVPGEVQCQWCPARGGCSALAEARMEAAVDLFDVIVESEFEGKEFPETGTLTNERLGQLYAQIEGLSKIRDDLKAEMQRRLHRGMSVPGFQLVNYTPRSQWKEGALEALNPESHDESVLPTEVIDRLWKKSLLSPTQAIKVLGQGNEGVAEVLEDLIDRPAKRPVVAPEGDRRKPWEGAPPEEMFADESTADIAGLFKDES